MRLRTLRVRNYRVHRECVVDFDPSRTLIGGPNESGKSTLVEALHRAFFLKSKGNTELHRAMVSTHGGEPEVEVAFEAGGTEYEIKKRFGGRGTTTLLAAGRSALAGDEAEAKIAELLAIGEPATGKAIAAQWGHLWIRQGTSGDDPTSEATAQRGPLIQRLQEMGGAAALQSDLDAALAARFGDEAEAIFRKNGEPKAGSAWEIAAGETEAAAARRQAATERVEASLAAAADLEAAARELAAAEGSLGELRRELAAAAARSVRVEGLRRTEEREGRAVGESGKALETLRAERERIGGLAGDLERRDAALEPLVAESERLRTAAARAKAGAAASSGRWDAASAGLKSARARRDHLAACVAVGERAAAVAELAGRGEAIASARQQLAELRNELARLPAVSEAKFRELRGAEDEVTRSQAALDAMAAGLEVLAADAPVAVDGTPLAVGGSVILSDDAEVTVGVGVRLRIRPGGGTSLAEARVRLTGSRDDLDRLTGALGIKTIAEAGEALASRRSLGAKIEAAEASLSDRQADELPARLAAAREALVSAEAERDRRSEGGGPSGGAEDLAAAERSLAEADRGEADARASRDGDAKSTADAEGRFARHVETIDQERRAAGDLRAQLKLLEETHGDAAARTERLRVAEAQLATASQAFAATQASLAELDAAHLAADLARLGRARETTTAAMNDARTRIAVARSSLRTDGIEDPRADLASAVARHDAATVRLDSARRRAEAVRLLDRLFSDQQRSLADRFTRPLAETISGYLACLFGGGARAAVVFHENEFAGLELTRTGGDGSAFGFETLSGGAREQFAAAVRLAVAEVLSADFGGTLPVVFDDAFAYADPERVRTLQRMLDRAAERGLQVIVLSCNPADYAGLGATLVPLSA